MNDEKAPKTPFFTRFLENQEAPALPVKTGLRGGAGSVTKKYPSDRDETVTLKYPSDNDEGGVDL